MVSYDAYCAYGACVSLGVYRSFGVQRPMGAHHPLDAFRPRANRNASEPAASLPVTTSPQRPPIIQPLPISWTTVVPC